MTQAEADAIAQEWIETWNSHDVERILEHYADDIIFHSPVAELATGDGRVQGMAALRTYWSRGLAKRSGLNFTLIHAFAGHRSVAIHYSDELGRQMVETLIFNDQGKVETGTACYEPAIPSAMAHAR
ncbi:MAG: nuclear transport factor 2 family protein [Sphingobium sp.]|nr:nuclear transport factor 2 family protein [Sphingobium sp.]